MRASRNLYPPNQIIQRVRQSFDDTLQWHVFQRIDHLRVLGIGLEAEDDEAGKAGGCEKLFALFLDFCGVHH